MTDRGWMYSGWKRGRPSNEWVDKTNEFLDRAYSIPELVESDTIKCPCAMCRNYFRHKRPRIELHLCQNGFKEHYETWTSHGERRVNHDLLVSSAVESEGFGETDRMDDMLVDLAGGQPPLNEEAPTGFAETFYRMAVSADERVHDQTLHSRLSAVARLLAIKSQYNLSVACYDDFVGLMHELLPPNSRIPQDFYRSKKLLEGLGMPYHKIDVCEKNCMLYYGDNNKNKDKCDKIGGGLPHGRLAIGDGAVKKATIIDVAKASGTRPTTSRAFQNLLARYEESVATVSKLTEQNVALAQQNVVLTRDVKRNGRLLELIIGKVQIEIPPELLQEEENEMGGDIDGSSHASANLDNSDGH